MTRSLKIISVAAGVLAGLLVLAVVALALVLAIGDYRPRLEAAVSAKLGMEARIGGRVGIGFYPGLHVTLGDVHIRNRGTELFAAKEARIGASLLGLFRQDLRMEKLVLVQPRIFIEKGRDGRFNFEKPETAPRVLPDLNLANLSVADGMFIYADRRTGTAFEASGCSLAANSLRITNRGRPGIMKNLSFGAELTCGEVRTKSYAASGLKFSVAGQRGIFDLKAWMRIFNGHGSGDVRADYTGAAPLYQVRYSLSRFHIDAFLKALSTKNVGKGSMDFSANLSLRGKSVNELKQSTTGLISLRGKDLILNGRNLDEEFARFEASQSFNLVDAGAFLFAGPVGLAITKGYDFANVVRGSQGNSEIRTLVSDWKIARGVAHAQDVALATNKNRVAFRGGLDFVNQRFNDVSVALVDAKGCARVQQKVHGSFGKPVVETPSVIAALAGPVRRLLNQAESIFPGETCEVFYAGSVASP